MELVSFARHVTHGQNSKSSNEISSVIMTTSILGCFLASENFFLHPAWKISVGLNFVLVLMIVITILATLSWISGAALVKLKPEKFSLPSLWDPMADLVRFCLWVFGIVIIIYRCLAIAIKVSCYNEMKAMDNDVYVRYMSSMTLHIAHICLVVIQSISTYILRRFRLRKTRSVNFLISFITLHNAIMWMYTAFRQGYGIRTSHQDVVNKSIVLVTDCYWNSTLQTNILHPTDSVYIPMKQNFHFLTICLTTIFSSSKRYSTEGFLQSNRRTPEKRICPHMTSIVATAFTFMVCIPVIVLCWLKYNSNSMNYLRQEWEASWCLLKLFLISVIYRGFHIIRKANTLPPLQHSQTLKGEDLVIILLSFGNFAYETVEIFDSFASRCSLLLMTKCILSMIQSYLQTVFIICLRRIHLHALKQVRVLVSSLMTGNFVLCLHFNFVAVLPMFESDVGVFGASWTAIRLALMYVISFYTLLSFLYLYRMFRFALAK